MKDTTTTDELLRNAMAAAAVLAVLMAGAWVWTVLL